MCIKIFLLCLKRRGKFIKKENLVRIWKRYIFVYKKGGKEYCIGCYLGVGVSYVYVY